MVRLVLHAVLKLFFLYLNQKLWVDLFFSSSGGTLVGEAGANEFILTNTFGETKTKTVSQYVTPSNTFILNEGFQQPDQWFYPTENQILVDELEIDVYPNPFSGNIVLNTKSISEEGMIVNVYSSDSRLIYSTSVYNKHNELNLNHLSPGKYIFEFTEENSHMTSMKSLIKSY